MFEHSKNEVKKKQNFCRVQLKSGNKIREKSPNQFEFTKLRNISLRPDQSESMRVRTDSSVKG